MVASELRAPFTYSERFVEQGTGGLYPVAYQLPRALREVVRGRRVAIVNDVINAGSAVRGTYADLRACGADPVAIGTLAVRGDSAARFADENGLALEALAARANAIWAPTECPLCARGVPLMDLVGEGLLG
jgi:orotate phosphoribosyltransferase